MQCTRPLLFFTAACCVAHNHQKTHHPIQENNELKHTIRKEPAGLFLLLLCHIAGPKGRIAADGLTPIKRVTCALSHAMFLSVL